MPAHVTVETKPVLEALETVTGFAQVKHNLIARVQADIAAELAGMEIEEDLDAGTLNSRPDRVKPSDGLLPGLYARTEILRIEPQEFPALMFISDTWTSEGNRRRMNPNNSSRTVAKVYRFRIVASVRGQQFEDTDINRDRFLLAIERCLTRRPQLARNASIEGAEEGDWSGIRQDPRDNRTIAGGMIRLAVKVEEEIGITPTPSQAPDVDTIEVIESSID